jgi:hypothetical protein
MDDASQRRAGLGTTLTSFPRTRAMVSVARILAASALALVLLLPAPTPAAAQDGEEPLLDSLRERLKSREFSLGLLLEVTGDLQSDRAFPGENGFGVGTVRLDLRGELDGGWGYRVQTEFGGILDAFLSFRAHPSVVVDGGLFKAPFSAEFLLPSADIDMIDRPQIVRGLVPRRKVGAQVRGAPDDGPFAYRVGVFNRGGPIGGSDDGTLLWVARATYGTPELRDGVTWTEGFRVGVNVARGGDRPVTGAGLGLRYTGIRELFGADVRFEDGPWLATGEIVAGRARVPEPRSPWGFEATAGYRLTERSQILARWDFFSADVPGTADSNLLILGWNHWPTGAAQLQANLAIPMRGPGGDDPRFVAAAQIAF